MKKAENNTNVDYTGIGQRIKTARKELGMTQEELAAKVNMSLPYISNIENANSKVALPTLVNISQVLEKTVDYLLYDSTPILIETYDLDAHEILKDCSQKERLFLLAQMISTKELLRKNKLSEDQEYHGE